jgi:hypothetical protein
MRRATSGSTGPPASESLRPHGSMNTVGNRAAAAAARRAATAVKREETVDVRWRPDAEPVGQKRSTNGSTLPFSFD